MSLQSLSIAALAACFALAGPLGASPLDELARQTEEQGQVTVPLRADIEARIDGIEGKKEERMVLLVRRSPTEEGVDLYLEVGSGRARYLILADGASWAAVGGKVKKVSLETAIDGTNWTLEDLRPFTIERCGVMRNVDESARQMTILCNPEKGKVGQYVLSVYKIDRERALPKRVLYYQERQDNLVKMLRNEAPQLVGRKWRPTKMIMRNFKLRTKDVFDASWSQDPAFPPETFDPKGFAEVSLPPADSKSASAE